MKGKQLMDSGPKAGVAGVQADPVSTDSVSAVYCRPKKFGKLKK